MEIKFNAVTGNVSADDLASLVLSSDIVDRVADEVKEDVARVLNEDWRFARTVAEYVDYSDVAEHMEVDIDALAEVIDMDALGQAVYSECSYGLPKAVADILQQDMDDTVDARIRQLELKVQQLLGLLEFVFDNARRGAVLIDGGRQLRMESAFVYEDNTDTAIDV